MASQEPYPLATIGVDPITSVEKPMPIVLAQMTASPDPDPATPKPVAEKSVAQKVIDRLLGIEGEKRYQIFPERVARSVVGRIAHGLGEGAKVVKAAETGAYGQPGTHEFTDRAYKDVFTAAKDNLYPGEMAAFHRSGMLSPLNLDSVAAQVGKKAVSKAMRPLVDFGDLGEQPVARQSKLGPAPAPQWKPLDPDSLTQVGPQMGSNPGGVFADKSGAKYYVKAGKSPDHVRNEKLAAALYQLAGTPTLTYREAGPDVIATELATVNKGAAFDPKKDFATHAWLGNWDVAGLGGENMGRVGDHQVALDLGGAMKYRAMGAPKGEAFGNAVGEWDTLRNPKINPDSAKLFAKTPYIVLHHSAQKIAKIPDEQIAATVTKFGGAPELANKLIARKYDLMDRAHLENVSTLSATLSEQEQKVMTNWAGSLAYDINHKLLHQDALVKLPMTGNVGKYMKLLDSVLAKSTTNKDLTVWRGLKHIDPVGMKPGEVFNSKTYASTSLDPLVASGFAQNQNGAILKIEVPQGAHAFDLRKHSGFGQEEAEIVLPRNTKYKILAIEPNSEFGKPVIHAQVLPMPTLPDVSP